MKKSGLSLLMFCLSLFQQSCIVPLGAESSYSRDWAPIATASKEGRRCVNLSGRYAADGKSPQQDHVYNNCTFELYNSLFKAGATNPDVSLLKLEIIQTDCDSIKFISHVRGNPATSRTLSASKAEFELNDDGIRIEENSSTSVGAGAGNRSSGYAILSRAKDGALIGDFHHSTLGLALLVPYYTSFHRWCRFSPN